MKIQPVKRIRELQEAISMTTYEAGLIQARAYRNLEQALQLTLRPFGITLAEWALLGSMAELSELRSSEIATLLGVTKPMATALIGRLSDKGLVDRFDDASDSRVVLIRLTDEARAMVPRIEKGCRRSLSDYLQGVSRRDLLAYLRVLSVLATKN